MTLLPGTRPSPWQLAYQAVLAGDTNRAQRVIVEDLVRAHAGQRRPWAPPTDAPIEALRAVVDTLPADLPPGNAYSETVLAQILLATGDTKRAGEYAARALRRASHPAAGHGRRPSGGADGRSGQRRCSGCAPPPTPPTGRSADERAAVAHVLDNAPELAALRADAGFRAARMTLG